MYNPGKSDASIVVKVRKKVMESPGKEMPFGDRYQEPRDTRGRNAGEHDSRERERQYNAPTRSRRHLEKQTKNERGKSSVRTKN